MFRTLYDTITELDESVRIILNDLIEMTEIADNMNNTKTVSDSRANKYMNRLDRLYRNLKKCVKETHNLRKMTDGNITQSEPEYGETQSEEDELEIDDTTDESFEFETETEDFY